VRLLGAAGALRATRTGDTLRIELPSVVADQPAYAFALTPS
jgi:hypothetical protein